MKAKLLDKEGCVYRGGGKAQELEGTARAATRVQCLILKFLMFQRHGIHLCGLEMVPLLDKHY